MNDFTYASATKLTKAIQAKRISSVELLELYIERYERLNPRINAIVAVDFDNARIRARAADETLSKGESWGPLHGLPMTVKDTIEVKGMPCTSGYPKLKDHMPDRNADVIGPLLEAGAIIFGKTNPPLFGMDFQSYNEVYGQTNNPWDASRVPGGSSGGSAAALAAGLTGLEMGSDIAGSLRIPAHFCGVYAHKPTFDMISFRGHIPPFPGLFPGDYSTGGDIVVVGPLARSAEDLDLVMNIIAQPQKPLQIAWKLTLPQPRKKSLKEYRIGVWLDDPAFPVDRAVLDCLQHLVDRLAKAGARIEERRPDINFTDCHDIYVKLLNAVTSTGLPKEVFERLRAEESDLAEDDKSFRAQLIRGTALLHRDWLSLDYLRLMMRQKWADFFKEFDVLLCPVAPVTAFPHDHSDFFGRTLTVNNKDRPYADTMTAWAGLTCVSYLPATVAPTGLASNGLPIGVQIVGPYFEDRTPIHFAKLIEKITGGFRPPPGFE